MALEKNRTHGRNTAVKGEQNLPQIYKNIFAICVTIDLPKLNVIAVRACKDKSMSEGDEILEYEYVVKRERYVDDDNTALIVRRGGIRVSKDEVVENIHVTKGHIIDNKRLHYQTFKGTVLIEYKGCDYDTQYEGMCVMCYKSGKLALIVGLDQTLVRESTGTVMKEGFKKS
ncbi:hypothetical protein BG015_008834 [Linnemannia schmuckeri]|uniref:Uncharacterized protein n=1 Tax=Linnemannia schmuckeri TaxID=64567 RepID=A0A9P5RWD0_9FUNG|nr:hypothetical protein BG015_008834 [Linnemannia schmuckeri]